MGSAVAVKKKKLSNNKKRKLEQLYNDAKLAYNAGNLTQSEQICQQIFEINAESENAYHVLGLIAKKMGNLESSKSLLEHGFKLNPNHPGIAAALGEVYAELKDFASSEICWNRYAGLVPDDPHGWRSLCAALCYNNKFHYGEQAINKAIELLPKSGECYRVLGLIQVKTKRMAEAEKSFRRAVELEPEDSEVQFALGRHMMESGEMDEARDRFREILKHDPNHAPSYQLLLLYWKVEENNELVRSAERVYADLKADSTGSDSNTIKQQTLAFALGKAWEDLGDYDKSFAYYADGNLICRSGYDYNLQDDRRDMEDIKRLFTKEMFDQHQSDRNDGEDIIFIVGMPRSGSTLMDRIISAHPKVVTTGETDLFRQLVGMIGNDGSGRMNLERVINASDKALGEAARAHLKNVENIFGKAEHYIDKGLPNLWVVGAIRLILPKAKILHCSRNPLDNCLSIFAHNFEGHLFKWAYDLKELGEYYRHYLEMMDHWNAVLPEDYYYNVSYEQLVNAPEEETRRIIAFCGLEWDDACLSFYKKRGVVQTASLAQVREPINKRSVERWRKFEKHLQPLIEALGDAVDVQSEQKNTKKS